MEKKVSLHEKEVIITWKKVYHYMEKKLALHGKVLGSGH